MGNSLQNSFYKIIWGEFDSEKAPNWGRITWVVGRNLERILRETRSYYG